MSRRSGCGLKKKSFGKNQYRLARGWNSRRTDQGNQLLLGRTI
jgi:hypothetical protein